MDFKVRLRQARLSKGLSQQVLASRLGLSKQAISNYESGANTPTFPVLLQLSRELGVSLDCLAGIDGMLSCQVEAIEECRDATEMMRRLSPSGRREAFSFMESLLEKETRYGAMPEEETAGNPE